MDKEIWKDVPNYIDIKVSNLGNVLRLNNKKNEWLKPAIHKDKDGYLHVNVKQQNGKRYTHIGIHRLVAFAFIPNPNNKPYVNHKDSNITNNKLSNLEWVTAKENHLHAYLYGNLQYCKKVPMKVTLTDFQVSQINKLREYYTVNQISKLFNCKYSTLKNIIRKQKKSEILDNQQPSPYTSIYFKNRCEGRLND